MCVEEHKFNETSKPKMDKPYCNERNILQQTLKYAILFPSLLRVFNTSNTNSEASFRQGIKVYYQFMSSSYGALGPYQH